MNSNGDKFVIKIENRTATSHPILYNNFRQVTGCIYEETPTNEIVGPYGYAIFVHTPPPIHGVFEHPPVNSTTYVCKPDGTWTNTWTITPFTEEEIVKRTQQEWTNFKFLRNMRLRDTDWTQLADVVLTETQKAAWNTYRQALRDLPDITTDPFNPVWPTPPR